jgi:multiple sugar transport system ATP-binding protein
MAEVILGQVVKVYPGNVTAVRDVDLHIRDKELLVLVGPSGCGKSTILRMVAGLEEITRGTIRIGDRVVNDVPPKDRDIAMVFQNYALYPHMTVYKNMAFGLKLRKYPKSEIEERVKEAARILGITELLDRKPKALSGGQRQRVAVGRAIVRKPAVFLFDEPLSNLDAKLVVLKDGVVQQVDEPLKVYEHPENLFVAGFVGTPPMNFLRGSVESANGSVVFSDGENRIRLQPALKGAIEKSGRPEMVLGGRPEDLHPEVGEDKAAETGASLRGTISVTEPLGDEILVYINVRGHDVIAKASPRFRGQVNDPVSVALDVNKLHPFDAETGDRVQAS